MVNRFLYSLFGFFLGLALPVGWLLWRAYGTRQAWWDAWLKKEFQQNDEIYGVLALAAVTIFSGIGYLIGRREDGIREASRSIHDSNVELSQLASTDGLTGLFNARSMHERLDIEIENAFRSPLACLLVDIDHFKKINDSYGHPFGDTVLVDVAQILKHTVRRADDTVGRLGGEEFIILLPHTPPEGGLATAERIRKAVEEAEFLFEERKVAVTVSLGVVAFPSEGLRNKDSLLKAVDDALYKAKRSGRNRVFRWMGTA